MAIGNYFKGLAFPFQQSATAFPAGVSDAELVKQSLLQLVQTKRGERVMRPNFGCNVVDYVFDNNGELTSSLLQAEIASAVGKWEPRAKLDDIRLEYTDTTLTITILYTVVTTQTQDAIQVSVPVNAP